MVPSPDTLFYATERTGMRFGSRDRQINRANGCSAGTFAQPML